MTHPFHRIVQNNLPFYPWADPRLSRLPGVNPLDLDDWLPRDAAFDAQMGYADWLLCNRRDQVFRCDAAATEACEEVLARVAAHCLRDDGYEQIGGAIIRPDGAQVPLSGDPLETARRLTQSDLVVMSKRGAEHLLAAAALCFPASWSLEEKFMRQMVSIHAPVDHYDNDIAKRVQAMFDRLQPGRGLWRANYLVYDNPDLFQPRTEDDRRGLDGSVEQFMRVERQTLLKLPETNAIVFGIHTYVVPLDTLPADKRNQLPDKEKAPVT